MTPHDGGYFWQGLPDCDAVFEPENIRPGGRDGTGVVLPDITRKGVAVPFSPRNLPASLAGAPDALEADTDFVEAFGAAYVDRLVTVKRAEWDRYRKWTTVWETNEYLPFL